MSLDNCFQVKLYCTTGVVPFGAQVRTRVGLSLSPDPSTNTITRFWFLAFFRAGQRLVFHSLAAFSSRCEARFDGRCAEKTSLRSTRQICGCDSLTPKWSHTTCRTRGKVQSSVAKPLAKGPATSTFFNTLRSASVNEAGRPRKPVERSASRPPTRTLACQPHTVKRATPISRATSVCYLPFSSILAAFSR